MSQSKIRWQQNTSLSIGFGFGVLFNLEPTVGNIVFVVVVGFLVSASLDLIGHKIFRRNKW